MGTCSQVIPVLYHSRGFGNAHNKSAKGERVLFFVFVIWKCSILCTYEKLYVLNSMCAHTHLAFKLSKHVLNCFPD